jgi:hypothetical protein
MKLTKKIIITACVALPQLLLAAPKCSNTLEGHYSKMPSWLSLENQETQGLHLSCVEHSMNIFAGWAQTLDRGLGADKGIFISCNEDSVSRSYTPQCQTPAYMQTTLNTFNSITDCLDVDQQNLYAIIASESGFYHNSVSSSLADFGFGQVTDPAIFDVNNNWYNFIDTMEESNKASCQNLVRYIKTNNIQPVDNQYQCSLTEAKTNPLLNALYTGMHYKMISGYLEDYSERTYLKKRIEEVLGTNFTFERYIRIKEILVSLSYNLGHNGSTAALEKFIAHKKASLDSHLEKRRSITREMATINLLLLKDPRNTKLIDLKKDTTSRLRNLDKEILALRSPQLFNGDNTPGSFGVFLQEQGISNYLKILKRRMKNIGIIDKGNLCPTRQFLQVR